MLYGAKIWGWEEREKVEKLQEKYVRWTLGLDWRTPEYMIREEVKWEKMRTRAGRRAMGYEEKLTQGNRSELARKCLMEIRKGKVGDRARWEEGRRRFFEERGFAVEEIEKRGERGRIGNVSSRRKNWRKEIEQLKCRRGKQG